ncbi:MAG TPA: DUF480 domain-containing protein [Gemmataceae bacterium]|nr:DUF480 domain-containing protein [Gemmataceae bacterium]
MVEPLTPLERRVLGVLVEKSLTTATPEPLTLNALVTGCNQKSNRDPVMSVEDPEADAALEGLQRRGLVFKITGGRAERWRHNLYDAWQASKGELALLAELLLRGPQTAAEARSRASRMEPLDHEEASRVIKGLVDRGMVIWLTPEHRRGAVLTHGFHPPDELERLKSQDSSASRPEEVRATPTPAATPAPPPDQLNELRGRGDEAVADIGRLRAELQELRTTVQSLQAARGSAPGESSGT